MKSKPVLPEKINEFLIQYMVNTLNEFCAIEDQKIEPKHTGIEFTSGETCSTLVIRVSGNKDKRGNLRRFDMHLVHLDKD